MRALSILVLAASVVLETQAGEERAPVVSATPATFSYIKLSGPKQVDEDSGGQFTCTAYYDDGSTSNVTADASWSDGSPYASVDSNGYATTATVPCDKFCQLKATYGGKRNTFSFKIRNVFGTLQADMDFDGNGYSEAVFYFAPMGTWWIRTSEYSGGMFVFGYHCTLPVTGDFDGDGVSDRGCYDPAGQSGVPAGSWSLLLSRDGLRTQPFGYAGTEPVVGDFDGDEVTDIACYDAVGIPGTVAPGTWYFMQSSDGFMTKRFGYAGTVPVVGDFDGDGKDDYGCYDAVGIPGVVAPGTWYFMQSSDGFMTKRFGYRGTVPIIGDFDGDGKDDYGCYDAAGIPGVVAPGTWYFMQSSDGLRLDRLGHDGTVPVVADFDGDDTDDYGWYDAAGTTGICDYGTVYLKLSRFRPRTFTIGHPGGVMVSAGGTVFRQEQKHLTAVSGVWENADQYMRLYPDGTWVATPQSRAHASPLRYGGYELSGTELVGFGVDLGQLPNGTVSFDAVYEESRLTLGLKFAGPGARSEVWRLYRR